MGDSSYGGAYLSPELIPLGDTGYLEALKSVLHELARGPSLVVHGRGSQFILKDHPGSLHVLMVAPIEVRVKRVMQELGLDQEDARQEITRVDTSRHEFVRRYFHAELLDPVHYDLVINTRSLSFEAAASIIVNAFRSGESTERTKGQHGNDLK